MLSRSRTAVRSVVAGAVVASPLVALAAAAPASADTPVGWEDGESMSGLEILIIFGAIPLALILGLALFGFVLARRTTPSYLPYVASPDKALAASTDHTEIASGH